jgi:hypothetical protein
VSWRAARLGLAGAMIREYPLEDRGYDQPEYEKFWAAAAALDKNAVDTVDLFQKLRLRGTQGANDE